MKLRNMACQMISENNLESVDFIYEKRGLSFDKQEQMAIKTAKRSMRMITKGNYPALLAVIDVIENGFVKGLEAGLAFEANTFAQLAISEVSRNLVFLFFNTELIRQSALTACGKRTC